MIQRRIRRGCHGADNPCIEVVVEGIVVVVVARIVAFAFPFLHRAHDSYQERIVVVVVAHN
jgi:hypothetical protein